MSDFYEVKTVCGNCGHVPTEPNLSSEGPGSCYVMTKIPKGQFANSFLASKKYKNCGCKEIVIKW